ncbi:sulfate ABC transporter permease subunit CysW [Clostridium intestinale]|jgi:sulfate transport system permease protein|uniref:sulfate ABC transporter permease subunit CysW n=1 Tax=Clostridium intestinale TaxID=36845 RepID=UPI002DD66FDA|nr:sulfate ABC transporter permease subunit CysW [Clostridium intestinale]WRY53309.1 sulfate ABC transporter permease subunit CysW [Clostridium intestinale]
MAGNVSLRINSKSKQKNNSSTDESKLTKTILISIALIYLTLLLIIPLIAVFAKAFEKGLDLYIKAITDPVALDALRLTLLTVLVAVPINTIFGLAASWALGKFEFKGKSILLTLLDIPFAISPVIAGLIFVLLFSTNHGLFADFLNANNIKIIFAPPGIIIATTFVTMPFVARELIPLMQSLGTAEEEAALTLGANGWQTFFKVTLPNIKWALFYGVILTTARAAGEFGAVSVVSGHIRGLTNTLPLHVEILYNEYQYSASFAVASLLTIIALINLIIKNVSEWKVSQLNINEEGVVKSEH